MVSAPVALWIAGRKSLFPCAAFRPLIKRLSSDCATSRACPANAASAGCEVTIFSAPAVHQLARIFQHVSSGCLVSRVFIDRLGEKSWYSLLCCSSSIGAANLITGIPSCTSGFLQQTATPPSISCIADADNKSTFRVRLPVILQLFT